MTDLRTQFKDFVEEFKAQRKDKFLSPVPRRVLPRVKIEFTSEERTAKLAEYKQKLRAFDVHFQRSEDPSVYRQGKDQYDELLSLRQLVDPNFEVWDTFFEGQTRF